MSKAGTGEDPRGRELKGRGWWLSGGGALAVAMLLVALALGSPTVQAQEPGAFYSGEVPLVGDCGGGTIHVNVGDDEVSVVHTGIFDFNAAETFLSGEFHTNFDPGAIPIAQDGSFTASFEPDLGPAEEGDPGDMAGLVIVVSGTFAGIELNGFVNVSPSTCGDMAFSARTFEQQPPPPPPPGALVFVVSFEPIFDFLPQPDGDGVDDCGGGTFSTTLNPDGTEVISSEVTAFTVAGGPVTVVFQFEPGEFPIDENGNFSNESEPLPGFSSLNEGAFDFAADPPSVSGTVLVFVTADPSNVLCEADYSGVLGGEAIIAAVAGSGPAAGSGDGAVLWLLAAGLGALALVATGLAVVRRRAAYRIDADDS